MPVSTRHSASTATTAGQQTKLNFTSKKNVTSKPIKPSTHDIPFKKPKVDKNLATARSNEDNEEIEISSAEKDEALSSEVDKGSPLETPSETSIKTEQTHVEKEETVSEEQDQVEERSEESVPFEEQVIERPKFDISFIGKDRTDEAYQITPQQIKAYYTSIRNSRIGPPVHQEGLTDYEKILRHFDLSSQYGPCVGSSRFRRWNRADRFGLEPPIEVLAVLLKSELAENVEPPPKDWKPAAVSAREDAGSVAYIDTLLDTHTKE
ncbi:hypothetical protein TWF694_009971 [Orbilia ellipsospora]|uniref:DNA polymerase delta subunit 4 n=1 Tax=Orbilia ellipsospora TaxID=2528407 RepID=A0AAV9XIW0_9PEZI